MSTRTIRRADRRKQKAPRDTSPRSFPWFTALVVVVGLVVAFVLLRMAGVFDSATTAAGPALNPTSIQRNVGEQIANQGNQHLDANQPFSGTYNSTPPTSGPHDPQPLQWGVYSTTQRDENMVHALEHGGVLIAYSPTIPDSELQQLKDIRSRWPRDKYGEVKIIIEPYPKLQPGEVALAAWTYLYKTTSFDEKAITGFIAAHADQGPEDAP